MSDESDIQPTTPLRSDPKGDLDEGKFEDVRNRLDLEDISAFLHEKNFYRSLKNTLNLILIPLLVLACIGVGFILVWAEHILVPFIVSVFFSYLLKPVVDFLSDPFKNIYFAKTFFQNITANGKLVSDKHNFGYQSTFSGTSASRTRQGREGSVNLGQQPVELTSLLAVDDDKENQNSFCTDDDNNGKLKHRGDVKIGCPRIISVFLTMMLALAILVGLAFFFIDAVQQFEQNNWDKYEARAVEIAAQVLSFLKKNFDIDGSNVFNQIMKEIKVFEITTSLVILLMDAAGYCFVIFLFTLYILFEDAGPGPVQLASKTASFKVTYDSAQGRSPAPSQNVRSQIDNQVQRYIVIKTLISSAVGFLVYIVLGPMLDVKLAHVFGVITLLANFVPSVGAVVATLLPFPILILDPDQTNFTMLLAIFLPVTIHMIVGNFIEPKVFGDTMELHAVVVLLSLSFWFAVWGIPGAILAVPVMAVLRIIMSNIKHPYAVVCLQLLEGTLPGL